MLDAVMIALCATAVVFFMICIFGLLGDLRRHNHKIVATAPRDSEQVAMLEEGAVKLVRFEDMNGRETFVNVDRVNHISDFGSGTAEINFGSKEASVFVAMEVSAVASTLLKAGKL
jgi:hypothetical protein